MELYALNYLPLFLSAVNNLQQLVAGIALCALIAIIIFNQFLGQGICNDIKDSDAAAPPTSCDISVFSQEYFNQSNAQAISVRYNDVGYRNVYVGSIILPIRDSDCALVVGDDEATKSIRSSQIFRTLSAIEPGIYRNACSCNAQSVGASSVCQTTSIVNSVIENRVIELAAENDKTTLNIIRAMAPAGYKFSSQQAGKIMLTAVNELKGNTPVGISYQVFDTYSCSLSDLGKRVYDYSLVGTRLTTEMKKGVFYQGSDQALINVNEDFKNLKDFDPAGMALNSITAVAFSGDKCPFNPTEPKYVSELNALTASIKSGQSDGDARATEYLAFITPIKQDAELTRADAARYFKNYNSLENAAIAVFRVSRLPEFVKAALTLGDARDKFDRGLYYSATDSYVSAVGQYLTWKQSGLVELVIDAAFWSIVMTVGSLLVLFKTGIIRFR